jgi:outer membrane protein assembly factor BamB
LLFAIDPLTGKVTWSNNIYIPDDSPQSPELTGSATIGTNGMIYIGSDDNHLYSFYPSGATNWVCNLGHNTAVYSTPAIGSNGTIYVTTDETEAGAGSTNSGVLAINMNGTINWKFVPQDPYYGNNGDVDSSPAIGTDGTIYFLAECYRLYAVSPAGHLKWFLPVPGDMEPDSSPAIGPDGTIYVGSDSEYAYAVNPDGSLKWIFNPGDSPPFFRSSAAIGAGGTVYFGCWDDNLYAVTNGSPAWTFPTGGVIDSAPAIGSNGTVYFGSYDQNLYAVTNGSQAWAFTTGGEIVSSPAIGADGTVYVASTDGNLYAIFGSTPLATNEPWPMFHQNPSHTGLQSPATTPAEDCGAPFVYDGTNDGMGDFSFSIVGTAGSVWNVYASTNLTNWTKVGTNLTLVTNVDSFNGNATFTDSNVANLSQRFYQLSNSGCASLTIGFVNLKIAPNTNLIANQLYQVDQTVVGNGPMNTLNALFVDSWGSDETETQIMTWNGQGFDVFTFFSSPAGNFWLDTNYDGKGGDATLLPGIGVLMNNTTGAPFTNTFVGLVREQQVFEIQANTTNYLSATLPVAGAIINITGYVPHNGDKIQLWNTTNQAFTNYNYISNTWSNGVPTLSVGEGFVLITTNAYTWTNTWGH